MLPDPIPSASRPRGHAPFGIIFGVTGVGVTVVATVAQAAVGAPPESLVINGAIALALATLVWFGIAIIKTRDAVLEAFNPETGVFVRLKAIEAENKEARSDIRRVAHHVGLELEG
jgi:hypothetical protein